MRYIFIIAALMMSSALAREPSVYVYNITKDRIEHQSRSTEFRSIASITKLMTAMVALDYSDDMFRRLPLIKKIKTSLPRNRDYTRQELFDAMLVKSDNAAAETLAADYPGGRKEFIWKMNQYAKEANINAVFRDPTGLHPGNMATAGDVANLTILAIDYTVIREASIKKAIAFEHRYKKKLNKIQLNNTNKPLLLKFNSIVISKTGFTNSAKFCVTLIVEQPQRMAIVILGEKNPSRRTEKVKEIMYNHVVDASLQSDQ